MGSFILPKCSSTYYQPFGAQLKVMTEQYNLGP